MTANTAPAWDGRPKNPEQDGWHWFRSETHDCVGWWSARHNGWALTTGERINGQTMAACYLYLAPCHTPAEAQAREAAAWAAGAAAMREMAADDIDDPHDDSEMRSYARFFMDQIRALPLPPMPPEFADVRVEECAKGDYYEGFEEGFKAGEKAEQEAGKRAIEAEDEAVRAQGGDADE